MTFIIMNLLTSVQSQSVGLLEAPLEPVAVEQLVVDLLLLVAERIQLNKVLAHQVMDLK